MFLKYFPVINSLFAIASYDAIYPDPGTTVVYLSRDQGQSWTPVFTLPMAVGAIYGQVKSWMALTPPRHRVFLYDGSSLSQLNLLGYHPTPTGLNDLGRLVGYTTDPVDINKRRAFSYSNGVTTDLGTLPGDTYSRALAINNNGDPGEIVGESFTTQRRRPFLYTGGAMTLLPLPSGHDNGVAMGLNNSGMIVGASGVGSANRAYLVAAGTALDLNTLISPGSGFSLLASAVSANDEGLIVGYGTTTGGETHAFLLTPVLPSSPTITRATRCPPTDNVY